MKPLPRPCAVCGKIFQPPKRHEPKYCSGKCVWIATKGAEYNAAIARDYAEKIGDTQRGRGDGKGYRKLRGRHEHRVVAEEKLGRPLAKGEVVHHKDGNKLNNSPDNLVITTQGQHMREHGLGIPGMVLTWKPWDWRKK